jgi:hypothetical protein
MRTISILAVAMLLAANALALLPVTDAFQIYLLYGALALSIVALVAILTGRRPKGDIGQVAAEPARLVTASTRANQAEVEIVSFLAMLQERGRLVDFLMEDITGVDDAQVGSAARVVHTGCKTVLQEHFRIHPVRQESEGSTVQVAAGYPADEYRLLGRISGQAPFLGVLVHRGWKTDMVKLPRVLRSVADRLPTIAPAEVELK